MQHTQKNRHFSKKRYPNGQEILEKSSLAPHWENGNDRTSAAIKRPPSPNETTQPDKNQRLTRVVRVGGTQSLVPIGGSHMGQVSRRAVGQLLKNLKLEFPHHLAIPPLGIYPEELKVRSQKGVSTQPMSILHPLMEDWKNKM
jgi:hypothetical protein